MAPLGITGPSQNKTGPSTNSDEPTSPAEKTTDDQKSLAVSRRELRATEASSSHIRRGRVTAKSVAKSSLAPANRKDSAGSAKDASEKKPKRRLKGATSIVVMTLAAGLIATVALPAYAFNPATKDDGQFGTSAVDVIKKSQSQSVSVSADASGQTVSRDAVSATTEDQLASQKAAAAAAAAAEAARAQAATTFQQAASTYSGPSASDYLANPPYASSFTPQEVFSVAQKYIGVPYVFGGATPAGFDCSGYIMFVYAQFGISLPHSVSGIAARGTRISEADAQPGDVVIMDGHAGFYAGGGNILDAPDVGRSISERPIWTSDYYIVRLGI